MIEKETIAMSEMQMQGQPLPIYAPPVAPVAEPALVAPVAVAPKPVPARFTRYPK